MANFTCPLPLCGHVSPFSAGAGSLPLVQARVEPAEMYSKLRAHAGEPTSLGTGAAAKVGLLPI